MNDNNRMKYYSSLHKASINASLSAQGSMGARQRGYNTMEGPSNRDMDPLDEEDDDEIGNFSSHNSSFRDPFANFLVRYGCSAGRSSVLQQFYVRFIILGASGSHHSR